MKQKLLDWLRPWRAGRISLRAKITAAFTLVVVGGTVVSTLIGSGIITNALLREAQERANHGLDTALLVYSESLENTTAAVRRLADSAAMSHRDLPSSLHSEPLDFFAVVPLRMAEAADPCLAEPSLRTLVAAAMQRGPVSATESLSGAWLAARSPALLEKARGAGLVLVAAVPVTDVEGRVAGAAYGGILLNQRTDIVDRVKLLVYGSGRYKGRPLGTSSILLGDVRIATNVTTASGERAIGTRASSEVSRAVLGQGLRWRARALILDDWYIAAYEPLRNNSGQVIGMLYVGILEAPILAVRTDVMLTFLIVCGVGLAIVFGFTYLITRRTISPLEEMVAATRKIAAGDLSVRVSANSKDEIGDLAGSFNDMLTKIQASSQQLEEWGRTLEERVRERTDQLGAVQAQMVRSEKLASIGRLAAGVAHSINNPLGGILSLSMLAQEGCSDPALRTDLDTIAKQALRCREIVKGLLEFSHKAEARVMRTDVNAVVESAMFLLQRQAVFHNITIERHCQPDVPAVLVDPGQLQEVITNLVVNAVDAMENGGTLAIQTESRTQPGTSGQAGPGVLIRVSDTGKGIPQEAMPFLFEPFFTTKTVGKGTGLGLAIVHGVVTSAGGKVEVSSSPAGTTFTVYLPAAPEGEGDGASEMAGYGARKSPAGS